MLLRRWNIRGVQATAAVSVISALVVLPLFFAFESIERLVALPVKILVTQIFVQGLLSGVLAVITYDKASSIWAH